MSPQYPFSILLIASILSPGNLLELPILGFYPDLLNQKLLGGGPAVCVLTNPLGDSDHGEVRNTGLGEGM